MPKGRKPTKAKRPRLTPTRAAFVPTDTDRAMVTGQLVAGSNAEAIRRLVFYPKQARHLGIEAFRRAFRSELATARAGGLAKVALGLVNGAAKGNAACAESAIKHFYKEEFPHDDKRGHKLTTGPGSPADSSSKLSAEQLIELRGEVARMLAVLTGQLPGGGADPDEVVENSPLQAADAGRSMVGRVAPAGGAGRG